MAMKRLEYDPAEPLSRSSAELIIASGRTPDVQHALVAVALHDSDVEWAAEVVVAAARSSDPSVRATAVLCLGHLARIHRRIPHRDAIDLILLGLADPDASVRAQASNAADDFRMLVPSDSGRLQ